jgi:hypothetical protein
MVCSATWTVTTVWAWVHPRASFWPAIMMTPVAEGRRCTVTGSTDGVVVGRLGERLGVCGLVVEIESAICLVTFLTAVRLRKPKA